MTETPLETDPTAYRNLKNARPLAGRIAHHWMPRRPRQRGILAFLGPGLITGASDDDPSGIATYSQVGAQFGYSMAWVMLFTWPLMTAIQEVSARIGRVTGDGIAGNIREHYPRWLLHVIVALLLGANIINLGADLGAMGAALGLLLGGPIKLYVVAFAVGCALLEIFARYENYVHILKWTAVTLFAYVAAALAVHVPWGKVAYNTLVPHLIWSTDYLVAIVAVLGTTITPYCFFWQSSEEAEDERIDPAAHPLREAPGEARAQISRIRADTYLGMGFSNLISLFIIITTAATLNAHGLTNIQTSAQAAEALRPIAGEFAFAVFAAGIIGIGLLAVPVLAGLGRLCVGRGIRLADRAQPPAARRQGVLRDDRGRDLDRHLHQFRRPRSDQGAVLVRGAERRRRRAADDRDHDHGPAAPGHGGVHRAAPVMGDGLAVDRGDGGRGSRDVCDLVRIEDRARLPGGAGLWLWLD